MITQPASDTSAAPQRPAGIAALQDLAVIATCGHCQFGNERSEVRPVSAMLADMVKIGTVAILRDD